MEEYAYILDIRQPVRGAKPETLCYALGDQDFKLFELVAAANAKVNLEDRVYIGKEKEQRTVITSVKRRIGYEDLSSTAQSELEYVVDAIVKADEAKFIVFFNKAGPISLRKHMLEELPGLGKKGMQAILDERQKKEFTDFADLSARVPTVKAPEKLITARIVLELSDDSRKRYLFVKRNKDEQPERPVKR